MLYVCVCVCVWRVTHQKALGVSGRSPLYNTCCILFHSEVYNTLLKHTQKKVSVLLSF